MSFHALSTYRPILSFRTALRFDIGAFFMRLFVYIGCIGALTMFTLLGYSAATAGTVSSTIALSQFIVSPRLARIIDRQGQSKATLLAALVMTAGVVIMLANVYLGGPFWLNYPAAILMGCTTSPQAMARARWTYLVQTQRYPDVANVDLKTVFSYEGVIDDMGFMIGPAAAIALSSTLFPEASFIVGIIVYWAGVALFVTAKDTEPAPGWVAGPAAGADAADGEVQPAPSARKTRGLLASCTPIRALFAQSLLVGLFFGILDTATVVFTQSIGHPNYATVALFVESFLSIFAGLAFGAIRLKWPLSVQVAVFGVVISVGYGLFALVGDATSMFVVYVVAAITYAPFIIVANTAAEHCVPSTRLTEALTWISAASTLGVAFGPTVGGIAIDLWGTSAGYLSVGATCALLAILSIAFLPLYRRHID